MKKLPLLLLSLGLLLDACAIFLIVQKNEWTGIVLHLVAIIIAAMGALGSLPRSYREKNSVLLILIAAVSIPTPLIGTVFLAGFCRALRLRRIADIEKNYVVGETRILTQFEVQYEPVEKRESILQTLAGPRAAARRKAVLSLRAMPPKKALPILQKAIQDSDEQVRLQAQSQFNKILATLEKMIKQLEAAVSKEPQPGMLIQLAEQYHELVFLETSSAETESIYLNRAVELLSAVLRDDPAHQGARYLRLKCYVKKGDADSAEKELRELSMAGFNKKLLEPWSAEVSYIRRDWPKLLDQLKVLDASPGKPAKLIDTIHFWLRSQGRHA